MSNTKEIIVNGQKYRYFFSARSGLWLYKVEENGKDVLLRKNIYFDKEITPTSVQSYILSEM
jgi:hypothetical protein